MLTVYVTPAAKEGAVLSFKIISDEASSNISDGVISRIHFFYKNRIEIYANGDTDKVPNFSYLNHLTKHIALTHSIINDKYGGFFSNKNIGQSSNIDKQLKALTNNMLNEVVDKLSVVDKKLLMKAPIKIKFIKGGLT